MLILSLELTSLDFYLQLQEFLEQHPSQLPLPPAQGDDTIFEYVVDDKGHWEHWQNRVSISEDYNPVTCHPY
jgi:dynein heavy chain